MAHRSPDDVLLPPAGEVAETRPVDRRLIAFVPIALALAGVGAILFGGLTARDPATAMTRAETDPVSTGSVAPPKDIRHILEMLDR